MLVLLLAPAAMGLCFLVLWLALKLKWSRMTVTLACAAIMGVLAMVYFTYPSDQAVCPIGGLVFGAVFGTAIGWTAYGAASDAIQRRQRKSDSLPPSSATSNPEGNHE